MSTIRLIDTHVHFFDLDVARDGLRWSWLSEASGVGYVPNTAPIVAGRFTPRDLFAEGGRLGGLTHCVHVQGATGTADGLIETRWLARVRATYGEPRAAVAHVSVTASDAAAQIRRQCEYPWVKGVRDPAAAKVLGDDRTAAFVASLARLGLVFEVVCGARRLADLRALAGRCPDTPIVLNHLALPPPPGDPHFAAWRDELARTAALPNVWLKISGLGLVAEDWDQRDVRMLVTAALDTFGPYRCTVGSNWPLDRVSASYPDVVQSIATATEDLGDEERNALFAENAVSLYRLT